MTQAAPTSVGGQRQKLGDYPGAIADFDTAILLNPDERNVLQSSWGSKGRNSVTTLGLSLTTILL